MLGYSGTTQLYPVSDKIYVDPVGAAQSYAAYYPYKSGLTSPIYPIDMSTGTFDIDLIWGKAEDVSTRNVPITFAHQMAKVTITFQAGGWEHASLEGATATLTGVNGKGDFNIITGTWSSLEQIALPLSVATTSKSKTLTLFIIPTPSLANTEIVLTVGGKPYSWKPSTASWAGGYSYNYTITYGPLSPNLGDIVYSDYSWSTAIESGKTPIGVVAIIKDKGQGYAAISLDEGEDNFGDGQIIPGNYNFIIPWSVTPASTGWGNMYILSDLFHSDSYPHLSPFNKVPAMKWVHNKNVAMDATFSTERYNVAYAEKIWYLPMGSELDDIQDNNYNYSSVVNAGLARLGSLATQLQLEVHYWSATWENWGSGELPYTSIEKWPIYGAAGGFSSGGGGGDAPIRALIYYQEFAR